MARTAAALPAGTRLTDFVSLGVLTARFPIETVRVVLARTYRASERERGRAGRAPEGPRSGHALLLSCGPGHPTHAAASGSRSPPRDQPTRRANYRVRIVK